MPITSATLAIVASSAVRPPVDTDAQLMSATVQRVASATTVKPPTCRFKPTS